MSAIETKWKSTRRGDARTQAILDAAIELLAEVGYERMTMDTVASRAKAGKATIYRRWPDKAGLVLDALRQRGSLIHDIPDNGSLRGDLECYVREAVAALAGANGSLMVGLLALASRDPQLAALLCERLHDAQLPAISELVDRGRVRHEVNTDFDASIISEVLPGVLIMRIFVLGRPADPAFIRRLVDDILMPLSTPGDGEVIESGHLGREA